jgi:O-antigen/teichoic acid export membrane protein
MILQVTASLILLLLLLIIINLIPLESKIKTMILLLGFAMIPMSFDMSYLFQAHEKMKFITYAKSLSQVIYTLTGFILIYRYKDIVSLPAASLISLLIGSITIYLLLKKYIKLEWSKVSFKKLKIIIKGAFPFLIGALMIHIYSNSNILMLQFFKGVETVGLYNAPIRIILFITGLSGFLTWSIYPALSKSYTKRRKIFNQLVNFSAWIFSLFSIPLAFGGIILASGIINLLYGESYSASIPIFSVLINLPIFVFLNCVFGNALSSSGHQKIATQAVIIAAFSNLVLNFILIPKYGVFVAAIVTIFTEIIESIYLYITSKRILKIEILPIYFIKPTMASIPMIVLLKLLPINISVLIKILLGGTIYLMAFIVIGGFKQYNLKSLIRLILNEK